MCGILGFVILSMRLGYFVKKNAEVKTRAQRGEEAISLKLIELMIQVEKTGESYNCPQRSAKVEYIHPTDLDDCNEPGLPFRPRHRHRDREGWHALEAGTAHGLGPILNVQLQNLNEANSS